MDGVTGDIEVDRKVEEWLAWDKNKHNREEIEQLVKKNDTEELRKRLCKRMEFGTAGLRSRMGAGYSMMNDLTIIQTTQGFVKYMLEATPRVKEKGVVIGYDARHNSQRFAELAATVLLNEGIRVYLYSKICPTPFVPYGVKSFGADWGIMVTASHNPKWDNGFKVYYSNSAQIIGPHDKGIASHILKNLEPWSSSWDTSIVENNPLRTDPYEQICDSYLEDLKRLSRYSAKNRDTPLKFTYTAMHGVGYEVIVKAFQAFNFQPCVPVVQQVEPDPDFPTVEFPNPEEGKSALDLAMQTATEHNSTVILANDPDADRLAIAELQPHGKWHIFTGNEIGTILGWWVWSQYKLQHPDSGSDVYCLSSTVSSRILGTIAKKEGFNFVETLTGFKWMGNKACDLIAQGKSVLFAFEEAIGFMCGTNVLDKDGISAAMVVAEMAVYLHEQGISIRQQLQNIYEKYGFHVSSNSYYICHDQNIIKALFERLRNFGGEGKYPTKCGDYPVKYIRDLTTGYDNSQADNKAVLPVSKSSQMLTFTFENGCVATMRTSGTEPKIKYYTEFIANPEKGLTREMVTEELKMVVDAFVTHFFEPKKNKLIARST